MNIDTLAQLFTVIILFVLVVVLAYFTSRFVGGIQKKQLADRNIRIMETVQIAAGKYLAIVSAGEQYFLIAVGKDTVSCISELNGDSLKFKDTDSKESFKAILAGIKNSSKVDNDEKDS